LLSLISFYGISESTKLNIIFTLIEIFGLLFIIVAAFAYGHIYNTNFLLIPFESPQPDPLLTSGLIFSAAALVFFAFFGFENLVNIADETESPHKTIPKALIISIIVTTIIYILVSLSSISLAGWHELYMSEGSLAAAAKKAGGNAGVVMLSAIGLFATANTVLMMLISGSRMIFGISNTMKSQLSKYLTKVHVKRKTPWVCIVMTMLAAIIIVQVFEASLFLIAGVSVFCVLVVYIIINITMISLRYQKNVQIRHLVSPISIGKFPLLPGLGIVFCIVILIQIHHDIIKNASICIAAIFLLIFVIIKSKNYLNNKRVKKC
jgi:APA family basic amino acid/polyamine antiporter